MKVFYEGAGLLEASHLVSGKVLLPDEVVFNTLDTISRFAGQTSVPFTVLQHTYLVYEIGEHLFASEAYGLSPEDQRVLGIECLYHDAAEAILCDVPKPIKECLPEYSRVEDALSRAYIEGALVRAGLLGKPRDPLRTLRKKADRMALLIEARYLLPPPAYGNIVASSHGDDCRDVLLVDGAALVAECREKVCIRYMMEIAESLLNHEP